MIYTREQVLAVMQEIIDEVPENYYYRPPVGTCVYFHEGRPSCLIGHVFDRLGVMTPIEGTRDNYQNIDTLLSTYPAIGAQFTPEARWLMHWVQDRQDHRTPWSEVLGDV